MVKEHHLEISSESNNTTSSNLYSISQVQKHNSVESAWIIVHGYIYDCTRFLNDHPGGSDSILINAGSDCTEEFEAIHSNKAKKLLEDYRIGELLTTDAREKIQVKLIEKTSISHDVSRFRFALPSENQRLGLPVGKHIFLYANINDKLCLKPYTPTSNPNAIGHIDLVVKVYFENGGLMSQHLRLITYRFNFRRQRSIRTHRVSRPRKLHSQ